MRILMVSKFGKLVGGVEAHLHDLTEGLADLGHDVITLTADDFPARLSFEAAPSSLESAAASIRSVVWNSFAKRSLQQAVDDFRPDVIHYHSIYHHLSPSVLRVESSAARVMTLHDYKLAAPCYTLFRNGEICMKCVGRRFPVNAVRFRCVKSSVAASSVCTAESILHQKRYISNVDVFIVPSEYVRRVVTMAGLPVERCRVVPWGVSVGSSVGRGCRDNGSHVVVLFGGRLHPSKGVGLLLDAWARRPVKLAARLLIAGDGELRDRLRAVSEADASVEDVGQLSRDALADRVRQADLCVIPSLAPETMGLAAIESLVLGTPIVSSGRGALADLAGAGVFEIRDMEVATFGPALFQLIASTERLSSLRRELAHRDLSKYTISQMVKGIEQVYHDAIARSR